MRVKSDESDPGSQILDKVMRNGFRLVVCADRTPLTGQRETKERKNGKTEERRNERTKEAKTKKKLLTDFGDFTRTLESLNPWLLEPLKNSFFKK